MSWLLCIANVQVQVVGVLVYQFRLSYTQQLSSNWNLSIVASRMSQHRNERIQYLMLLFANTRRVAITSSIAISEVSNKLLKKLLYVC